MCTPSEANRMSLNAPGTWSSRTGAALPSDGTGDEASGPEPDQALHAAAGGQRTVQRLRWRAAIRRHAEQLEAPVARPIRAIDEARAVRSEQVLLHASGPHRREVTTDPDGLGRSTARERRSSEQQGNENPQGRMQSIHRKTPRTGASIPPFGAHERSGRGPAKKAASRRGRR